MCAGAGEAHKKRSGYFGFAPDGTRVRPGAKPRIKVFCFFFSKKKCLPCLHAEDEHAMAKTESEAAFQRGWDAALAAARQWHEDQAKKAVLQSRKSRFPKNLEREAEVHARAADMMGTLSPDDV